MNASPASPAPVLLSLLLASMALAATFTALRLATGGVLPVAVAAFVVPAVFLALVGAVFRLGVALGPLAVDETGAPRPLLRRHGFWVVAASAVLGLPMLGGFGLIDPWESHYAEVAREMLARGDLISTWWAQGGWFLSKPVLDFWMQALSMALLGVHSAPDTVLTGIAGHVARPEWAVRLPSFLLATIGSYSLYKGVACTMGRRAGLYGALVLVTMPQWYILGHQSITDMPLVACLSSAMGLILLGVNAPEGARTSVYTLRFGRRSVGVHAVHLVIIAFVVVVLPQVVYLVRRSFDGIHLHADTFFSGSAGNCDLPGQPPCTLQSYVHPALQPALQALLWVAAASAVVVLCHAERRRAQVLFLGAWLFAGVATMGKGPAGVVLPAGVTLVYLVVTGRLRLLLSFEILTGILIVAAMVLPWYVAMYARHGRLFVDELVLRNMIGRTLEHIHDTNEGDDTSFRYYVEQLGYATFPWSGLLPAAALGWARARASRAHGARDPRYETSVFLVTWLLLAFGLFTTMLTKFHHYIFPAVPPAAMLTGIWLAETTRPSPRDEDAHGSLMIGAFAVLGAVLVIAIGRDLVTNGDVVGQARLLHLVSYQYHRAWPSQLDFRAVFAGVTLAASLASLALAVPRWRRRAAGIYVTIALAAALFGLDVYLVRLAPHWGQRELIATYYARRASDAEPLIAFQMNWKGENFYTGNRIAIFVSSGAPMVAYVNRLAAGGTRTLYFVLEHGRLASLRGELRGVASVEPVTGAEMNNKFVLARADIASR